MRQQTGICLAAFMFLALRTGAFAADIEGLKEPDLNSNPLIEMANSVEFRYGVQAPFLGVFTHVEPMAAMEDKIKSAEQVLDNNPFLAGVMLKIQWQQLHPEPDFVDFEGFEKLVDTVASRGKLVIVSIIPGGASPEWIYDFGVRKVGPVQSGRRSDVIAPLPWDYRYLELFWNDIRKIADRYGNDPRIFAITVTGHNYNYVGEEMHAPSIEEMAPHDWTRNKVLDSWKTIIDLYDEMFPSKKLMLVVSQNYRGADDLSLPIADYFVRRCQGRAILSSHQLHGRDDSMPFGPAICQDLSLRAPNGHEMVMSFKESPDRQGTPEMTVYNFVKCGNPLFMQLWRRDSDDPQYTKALLEAWNVYGWMRPDALKERLIRDGLYVETAPPPTSPLPVAPSRTPMAGE